MKINIFPYLQFKNIFKSMKTIISIFFRKSSCPQRKQEPSHAIRFPIDLWLLFSEISLIQVYVGKGKEEPSPLAVTEAVLIS